jgi:hypothetical protein
MSKKIGYKPVSSNQNRGYATHGSFKNVGQKDGKKTTVGKEQGRKDEALSFMKKTIRGLRAEGSKLRRIQMLPQSGAFH